MLYFCFVMIIYAFSSNKFRRWGTTAFVSVSNTCLTARLEIAAFYVPLPTIENVEICWKRRKIGHYRAVQFSEREAVSISPKQSVVGSTPTGLITQINNFFLVGARVCVLANVRRTSAGKNFFAFYWKSAFCPAAGVAGNFLTFRLFCQHRCSGKRAICLTFACAACQQFSALRIFWHYLYDFVDFQ